MRKPPCEVRVRYVLPAVRTALYTILERDFGLSLYQIAKTLGVTPAAISNYKSQRRSSKRIYEEIMNREDYLIKLREYAKKLVEGSIEPGEALCSLCGEFSENLEKSFVK